MSDQKSGGKSGGTLTLRGGGTETSRVRQSFSRGRSKTVVVEKKRAKRMITPPKPGVAPSPAPAAPSEGSNGTAKPAAPSANEARARQALARARDAQAQEAKQRQAEAKVKDAVVAEPEVVDTPEVIEEAPAPVEAKAPEAAHPSACFWSVKLLLRM